MTDEISHVPEITTEIENWRDVPLFPDGSHPHMRTSRRDPVEPVPVGTYVGMVFRVVGYDPDCDGSLMARLQHVGADGDETGWEPTHLGLYPHSDWVLSDPGVLDRLAGPPVHQPERQEP